MAGPLKKYAFLNAKLRARISQILPRELMEGILHSGSMTEALHLLSRTPYAFAAEVYDKTGDIKMVELGLFRREVRLYGELMPFLDQELQHFVTTLGLSYEIEVLKRTLRLWFQRAVLGRPVDDMIGYLFRDRIVHDLDIDSLVNAQDKKSVFEILTGTPYKSVLMDADTTADPPLSLFLWEVALDRYYFTSLNSETRNLHGRDGEIARRLMGVEIDRRNISWMIRLKTSFELPMEDSLALMVDGGWSIEKNLVQRAYQTRNPRDMLAELLSKGYGNLAPLVSSIETSGDQLDLIDGILREIVAQEVHRILLGYPFTIGVLLAYFILKVDEIGALTTALNTKSLGISDSIVGNAR